jgi:uroporphyrinogen-III synthase
MAVDSPCNLDGLKVLVTRPSGQAGALKQAILECGGKVERLPLLAIKPVLAEADRRYLRESAQFDDLIFISPNAVRHAVEAIAIDKQRVIAIGEATAALLEAQAIRVDLVPQFSNSEKLLDDERLGDMLKRRVLIIRGVDGRELLADRLRERGAEVTYAEVYRRCMPEPPSAELIQHWDQRVDAMIITSEQMLNNLIALTNNNSKILNTALVVISERLKESAQQLGFTNTLVAANPYPADLLQALCSLTEQH